jgi:hypothetical protein
MYDLCKILRISPSEYSEMSVTKIKYFSDALSKDIQDKDPFIVPSTGLRM